LTFDQIDSREERRERRERERDHEERERGRGKVVTLHAMDVPSPPRRKIRQRSKSTEFVSSAKDVAQRERESTLFVDAGRSHRHFISYCLFIQILFFPFSLNLLFLPELLTVKDKNFEDMNYKKNVQITEKGYLNQYKILKRLGNLENERRKRRRIVERTECVDIT
jgi:hypothetical protein